MSEKPLDRYEREAMALLDGGPGSWNANLILARERLQLRGLVSMRFPKPQITDAGRAALQSKEP